MKVLYRTTLPFLWWRVLIALAGALLAHLLLSAPAQAQGPDSVSQDTGTLSLGHYAPFGADIPSTAFQIWVDGTHTFTDVVYGEWTAPTALSVGLHTVVVFPGSSMAPVLSFTTNVSAGRETKGVLIGGAYGWPIDVRYPFDGLLATTNAALYVHHYAPFAEDSGDDLDFCLQEGQSAPTLQVHSLPYSVMTVSFPAESGIFTLAMASPGTGCSTIEISSVPFGMESGQEVHALVVGDGSAAFPRQVVLQGVRTQLTVAHLASFAATLPATAVSVEVSGTTVIPVLHYGEASAAQLLQGPGTWPIVVDATVSPTITLSTTLALTGYVDSLVVATGGSFQPYALRVLGDMGTEPDTPGPSGVAAGPQATMATVARLRFGHFAGVSSVPSETEFDVCIAGTNIVLFGAVQYGDVRITTLAPGYHRLYLAPTGSFCAVQLPQNIDVPLSAGDEVTVLLGGDDINQPVRLITTPLVLQQVSLPLVRNETPPTLLSVPDLLLVSGYTMMYSLLRDAELDSLLREPGPWTVFGVPNAAFAAMPPGELDALRADPTGALANFLRGHIVAGEYMMDELGDGVTLPTLAGTSLTFTYDDALKLRINGSALVTPPGTRGLNGFVFRISQVLPAP